MAVQDTVGAILIGALVSAILSGGVTTQALIYCRLYGRDDFRQNTLIVSTLWLLDCLHLAMAFASVWIYLIQHWGSSTIHDYIPWTIAVSSPLFLLFLRASSDLPSPPAKLTVAITAIVTLISHCFFAHRVYILSGCSWLLTAPIILLAGGRLAAALVSTFEMITLQSYEQFVDQVGWVFTMGLSLSTATDVFITVTLITLLQRSRTGFSTVVTTAVSLVCWLSMPRNLIFLALHFSISKLYATSTLATLNARKSLRRRTRQAHQHVLPVISSLHESQTRQGAHVDDLRDNLKTTSEDGRTPAPVRIRTFSRTLMDGKPDADADALELPRTLDTARLSV
ncbi:uncharacterized protein BXZ73DRAFT_108135 [Epithele typhae]|uniref:uncharacterized protein n=1 Tax=Epithele typhae TaxID=378194 RepID=UPI00200822D2|nr:uncharacterized protein BXZ73DRAFT_108135 [Epithele typhae]KAH9911269.1 hypothetical protein BXZ73DRAFT_108135 [Epithele typhae]